MITACVLQSLNTWNEHYAEPHQLIIDKKNQSFFGKNADGADTCPSSPNKSWWHRSFNVNYLKFLLKLIINNGQNQYLPFVNWSDVYLLHTLAVLTMTLSAPFVFKFDECWVMQKTNEISGAAVLRRLEFKKRAFKVMRAPGVLLRYI